MSSILSKSESPISAPESQPVVRFHLSLNVASLDASVRFFELFFGCKPAKLRADYAKFEVDQPALVLSLEPSRPNGTGVLNHVGVRMPDVESLVAMQRRLEIHGVSTHREEGIECCYAKQTKFWLHDPDGTMWEVYTLDEDIDHHGYSAMETPKIAVLAAEDCHPTKDIACAPAIWSHRLGQTFPQNLFVQPNTVDEIRLQGTFNMKCDSEQRSRLLRQCVEAMKRDAKLTLHLLTSDQEIAPDRLELTGAAAVVQQVIPVEQLVRELESVGFDDIRFEKYAERACFVRYGIELRESLLTARRSVGINSAEKGNHEYELTHRVFLKGPLRELRVGETVIRRGVFTPVTSRLATELQATFGNSLMVIPISNN